MIYPLRTVKETVTFEGRGLHTGVPVKLSVHPGNEGIAFRLGTTRTPAIPANVSDTTRSTRLGEVGTIEHLMSAFAGLEITDAEVELDAPEVPGMDGSSRIFVESLLATGLENHGERDVPPLFTRAFYQEDDGTKIAIAKGKGHWRYVYSTSPRWPHEMISEFEDVVSVYATEIAPARTFALAEEVPFIIQQGLGKGLDESSAVILGIEGYKNEVRFPDEPARHKLLDLIGDLYLAGLPIRSLSVVAQKTGHRVNVHAAKLLWDARHGEAPE